MVWMIPPTHERVVAKLGRPGRCSRPGMVLAQRSGLQPCFLAMDAAIFGEIPRALPSRAAVVVEPKTSRNSAAFWNFIGPTGLPFCAGAAQVRHQRAGLGWQGSLLCLRWKRKSPRAIAAGLNKEPVPFQGCLRKVQRGREEISLRPGVKGRWCSGFACRRGGGSQMRTWVNKRCCTIWSDHFCHRRGYRAEDPQNRLLWLIPEIKRTRLSGHAGWPRYSPAGEGTCWLNAHISESLGVKKPPHGWLQKVGLLIAGRRLGFLWSRLFSRSIELFHFLGGIAKLSLYILDVCLHR